MTRKHAHTPSPRTPPRTNTSPRQTKITKERTPRHPDPLGACAVSTGRRPPTTDGDRQAIGEASNDTVHSLRAGARVGHRLNQAHVDETERAHLTAGVGARLRAARTAAHLSQRGLARVAGCASSTVTRLESGQRRPRRSMLAALCAVLDPDGTAGLLPALVLAAGESLAVETPGGTRRRTRRVRVASARRRMDLRRAHHKITTADAIVRNAAGSLRGAISYDRITRAYEQIQAAQARAHSLRAEAAVILARHGVHHPTQVLSVTPCARVTRVRQHLYKEFK